MISSIVSGAAGTSEAARQRAALTGGDFLRLLTAELTAQDPLDPLENGELVNQMVGIRNLEQTAMLGEDLASLQRFLQLSSGGSLVGRRIQGTATTGEPVEGVVSAVVLENGEARVVVGDLQVSLESVTRILPDA